MKEIKLTRGMVALIDDDDYEKVSKYRWYAFYNGFNWYAQTRLPNNRNHIYMHRLVLGFPEGKQIDHINMDTLDNRKFNLRTATNAQNNRNKKAWNVLGIKGVSYYPNNKRIKQYLARIGLDYKTINLGWYMTAKEAAEAYNNAAIKYFGEFANLNVI